MGREASHRRVREDDVGEKQDLVAKSAVQLTKEKLMKTLLLLLVLTLPLSAQEFPTRWDELTASDWAKAQICHPSLSG